MITKSSNSLVKTQKKLLTNDGAEGFEISDVSPIHS